VTAAVEQILQSLATGMGVANHEPQVVDAPEPAR